jgi:hypothetical protein
MSDEEFFTAMDLLREHAKRRQESLTSADVERFKNWDWLFGQLDSVLLRRAIGNGTAQNENDRRNRLSHHERSAVQTWWDTLRTVSSYKAGGTRYRFSNSRTKAATADFSAPGQWTTVK